MQNRRVKIICFSIKDTTSAQIEMSWKQFLSFGLAVSLIVLLLCATSIAFFTDFYENLEISALSKVNDHLKTQLSEMGSKLTEVETRLRGFEVEDDELRIIANLPKIDEDTRRVGVGGLASESSDPAVNSNPLVEQVFDYQSIIDEMQRRIELAKLSRSEIRDKLFENNNILKHTPSIRPVIDGRLTGQYGLRLHPIDEKLKKHPGIDIGAERGTEVFATAAGVVEKVVTKYTRNRGYGKYVIVDHGYGKQTLYGHLSKVLVRKGDVIDRRKPVGLVGQTGKATGPHVHYEVIQDGKKEDPSLFILDGVH